MRASGLPYAFGLAFFLVAVAACSRRDELSLPEGPEHAVPVDLAFALQQRAETRASVSTILELKNIGSFRGMEQIRIVPFGEQRTIGPADQAIGHQRELPAITASWDRIAYSGSNSYHKGLIYNNQAHLYPSDYASMPEGTAAVLVYGKGALTSQASGQAEKHLYGSLLEEGSETEDSYLSASDIRFFPEPILSGPIPDDASELAGLLNGIARAATYTQAYYYRRNDQWYEGSISVTWNGSLEESVLRGYFEWFTGDGELMPGSGGCVQSLLSGLYSRLSTYYSVDDRPVRHLAGGIEYTAYLQPNAEEPLTYRKLYNGLRDILLRRFKALADAEQVLIDPQHYTVSFPGSSSLRNYPVSLGLPAGSAVVRWNDIQFVVVTEGLDGVASIDRFSYMPPLCYFANTTISTSSDEQIYKNYTESAPTWDSILSHYRQGKVVRAYTSAVALDKPLHFATGMLAATVRASYDALRDRNGLYLSARDQNFPVTGIILGSQYQQDFNFQPVASAREYYLYDNQISGIYLTSTRSSDFRTLVLPTPDEEDVYFFLELRNDSGVTFAGADGLIYPDNYFYLAGKLDLTKVRENGGQQESLSAVFVQDHMTTAECVVSSLENARVAIPRLDNPQLILGVQTDLNWIMSTGSYVVLD